MGQIPKLKWTFPQMETCTSMQYKFSSLMETLEIKEEVAEGFCLIMYIKSIYDPKPTFSLKETRKITRRTFGDFKIRVREIEKDGFVPVICRIKNGHGEMMFLVHLSENKLVKL